MSNSLFSPSHFILSYNTAVLFTFACNPFIHSSNNTFILFSNFDRFRQIAIMKFIVVLASAFAAIAVAAPTNNLSRRAVFATQTYAQLSISGGEAGNGKQEALDRLSGLPTDLSTVTKADLDFLDDVNGICNDVEKEVFNTAIDDATGDAADSLSVRDIRITVRDLTNRYQIARKDKEQDLEAHCYRS
jgi:hypothetical protein